MGARLSGGTGAVARCEFRRWDRAAVAGGHGPV